MARSMPLRHELKFYINEMQYHLLRNALDRVLDRDPNGDENNEYHIRSLYFDTVYNDALYDKLDGVQNRDKYRIRIYNYSDKVIRLERKSKHGDYISKLSCGISRDLAEQIIAVFVYDLPGLLISDKITHISGMFNVDLTFVVYWAILLLLSYVFRYGEELQQLSDETL